jgi:anti-anti-sigma regulatory factor
VQTIGAALLSVSTLLFEKANTPIILLSPIIYAALLVAYWRGWDYTRYLNVVIITLSAAFAIQEPYLTQNISLAILTVPILTLILTNPIWLIGGTATLLAIVLFRAGGVGVYAEPGNLAIFITAIGGLVLIRLIADTAQQAAEVNAARALAAQQQAEAQACELSTINERVNTQLEEQRQLLTLVTSLETPMVSLADGVLLAPIIGHIDTRRAEALTTRILNVVSLQHTRLVILDIAGVSLIDTAVARALLQTVQAVQLLGCAVTISGISASVAITLEHLGIDLNRVQTARSPQEALATHVRTAAPVAITGTKAQVARPASNGNLPHLN